MGGGGQKTSHLPVVKSTQLFHCFPSLLGSDLGCFTLPTIFFSPSVYLNSFFVNCFYVASFFSLTSRNTSTDSATLIASNFHFFNCALMQNVDCPMLNIQLYLRFGIIYLGTVRLDSRMPCMTTCTKANTIEN